MDFLSNTNVRHAIFLVAGSRDLGYFRNHFLYEDQGY